MDLNEADQTSELVGQIRDELRLLQRDVRVIRSVVQGLATCAALLILLSVLSAIIQ